MRSLFFLLTFISSASYASENKVPNHKSATGFSIGVRIKNIGSGETFVLSLGSGKNITVKNNALTNFPGTYPSGYKFKITQVSGPRRCNFTPGPTGSVTDADIEIESDGGVDVSHLLLGGRFKAPKGTVVELLNNGTDRLKIVAVDSITLFTFPKPYLVSSTCNIVVTAKPAGMTCSVTVWGGEINVLFEGVFLRVVADYEFDLVSRDKTNKSLGTYYDSWDPSICQSSIDEGRYVTFVSSAVGLCGSTGKFRQVFWRDRLTGDTKMISRSPTGEEGNGNSVNPVMSVSEKHVAFESYASNLVNGDNNALRDVFHWEGNATTGVIDRVSVGRNGEETNGESYDASMSADGSKIAFSSSASNLTEGVSGTYTVNIYLRNRVINITELITKDYKTGKGAGGEKASINWDGNRIAFYSFSNKLVAGDNNNLWDIFLYISGSKNLKRISLTSTGGERNQGTESASRVVAPTISGDGGYIAYATTASNVVPNDNNGKQDVFLYYIDGGTVSRISENNDGQEGNGDSPVGQGEKIALSGDGNIIAFSTNATNFGAADNNVVIYNILTKQIKPVTTEKKSSVSPVSISAKGKYVGFGCGSKLDSKFPSTGLFLAFTGLQDYF